MMDLQLILTFENYVTSSHTNFIWTKIVTVLIMVLEGFVVMIVNKLLLLGTDPTFDVHQFQMLHNHIFIIESCLAKLEIFAKKFKRYLAIGMEEHHISFSILVTLLHVLPQLPTRVDPLLIDVVRTVLKTNVTEVELVLLLQVILIFLSRGEVLVFPFSLLTVLDLAFYLLIFKNCPLSFLITKVDG